MYFPKNTVLDKLNLILNSRLDDKGLMTSLLIWLIWGLVAYLASPVLNWSLPIWLLAIACLGLLPLLQIYLSKRELYKHELEQKK